MGEQIGIVTGACEQLVECTYEKGGLAVHQWPEGILNNWTVTHISSGLSVAQMGESEAQAIAVLEDLVPLTDWTQPSDKLQHGVSEFGIQTKRIVERHGMALTTGHPSQHSIPIEKPRDRSA